MAVLVEAYSVVILEDRLKGNKRHYKQFLKNISRKNYSYDGVVYSVGFNDYREAKNYIDFLDKGLELGSIVDNNADTYVLVDMVKGPLMECDWLEFLRDKLFIDKTEFKNYNEQFSIAWAKGQYTGTKIKESKSFKVDGISFPEGWTPDNAILIHEEVGELEMESFAPKNEFSGSYLDIDDSDNSDSQEERANAHLSMLFDKADKYYSGIGVDKDRTKSIEIYEDLIDFGMLAFGEEYLDRFTFQVYSIYDDGAIGAKDYERCYILYDLLIKRSSSTAYFLQGHMFFSGKWVKYDLYVAINLWEESTKMGDLPSSYAIAKILSNKEYRFYDIDKAVAYCKIGVDKGFDDAKSILNELLTKQKTDSKQYLYNKSIIDFRTEAISNHSIYYELAESYMYGVVNDKDYEKGIACYKEILRIEIEKEDVDLVLNRFHDYIQDTFWNKSNGYIDYEISLLLLNILDEYAFTEALVLRSIAYFHGLSVDRDINKAVSILESGVKLGNESCIRSLVTIFGTDKYGLYNINKAINYVRLAIDSNVNNANVELLPLELQKENSEFVDVIYLFDKLEENIILKDLRILNIIKELIVIGKRDWKNDDFIGKLYANIKLRFQIAKNRGVEFFNDNQYGKIIRLFVDNNCTEAVNDLAYLLFYKFGDRNSKNEAINLWENTALNSNTRSIRNLMKIFKTDEYGVKDVEKYHKYNRLLTSIENPKVYKKPQLRKQNYLSQAFDWIKDKKIFYFIGVAIIIGIVK